MKKTLLLLLVLLTTRISAQEVKITYLANEGVMIQSGSQKVVIDALFDDHYEAYLSLSEADRNRVIVGQAPYDNINLSLATHIHRDHFEAQITGDFLSSHTESKLVSSEQIRTDLLEKYDGFSQISDRIVSYKRDVYTVREEINGILVHSFFINHSGGQRTANIENMGFIVEIGGKKILHLGDADMAIGRFKEVNLTQYDIDIALVPYWYMADEVGVTILNEHIKAKNLIGVHYPKVGSPMAMKEISEKFPEAEVFDTQFEVKTY